MINQLCLIIQFNKKEVIENINRDKFFTFVKACFKQRRKTLNNNLREFIEDKDIIESIYNKSGIDKNIRAQQISLDKFIELYKVYEELV